MKQLSTRAKWGWGVITIVVHRLRPASRALDLRDVVQAAEPAQPRDVLPADVVVDQLQADPHRRAAPAQELFLSALRNSIGICLIATAIAVVLATLAAYAIARLDFPGKRLVLLTALGVSIFPVISIVTPLFNLWREIGLYDTWLGLIIPYLSLTLPISIWTLAAFFRQIPWELEQAAQVDGATTWQAFRKAIVPLAAPGVFTTALIAFFIAWNDFVYGISLTSTSAARPVPGRARVLHRRLAVRGADGADLRRGHRRDHPGRHPRPALPAPDRVRPHPGCRQGLKRPRTASTTKELRWPPSP